MIIREYSKADLESLRAIHAGQGFDYAFPDLDDPLFVSKVVVENDAGEIVLGSLARLTCEVYFLSKSGAGKGPRERSARFLALHRAVEGDLIARGLEDAHAWLPPSIARRFGRRLESLGWARDDVWTPYCRRLNTSSK